MNITDRLCQTKEKDDRVSMMLLDPWVRFLVLFMYFTYFHLVQLLCHHFLPLPPPLTTMTTTRGSKYVVSRAPWFFFMFQHSYTTSTRQDVTAIISNNIRRVGPLWGFFSSLHFVCLFCAYIWIFFPHIFRSG